MVKEKKKSKFFYKLKMLTERIDLYKQCVETDNKSRERLH